MADYFFNVSKGRFVELFNRVDSEDPSTSRIVLVPLSKSGTEEQGQDFDNLKVLLEDENFTAQEAGGWERKVLTAAEITLAEPDDAENRRVTSIPEQTWAGPEAGKDTTGLLVCYDPKAGEGTDEEIVPISHHDFAVTADGNEVILEESETGRAS